jgi:hypothetical protein
MVQVGITSWTMDDCGGVAPAVFTDVGAVRDFVDPFTALSAPITIDLAKASWVDAVNLEAGAAGPCFVILTWQEAEPECPFMLSFRERSVTLWIAPPPGTSKTEVRVQAFTMDHLPLSTEWKLGVSPKAGVITKVTPDPKPCRATMVGCMDDVTVLRMKTDLSFAWVTIFDGADDETVCAYFTNYQMTGCSGPRAVALAGNAVAFFGPVPPLWTGGGGFDGWGTSVPMTPSLLLTAKPGLGTISDLTPKPVLSGAFYGLEIKVPKATSWEFAVYPADGGSPLDTCSVWTSVMDCDGAWWGLPGIIKGGAGRVFLPVAGPISKVDVEVLTYGPGGSQAGLSEGIQLVAGKITAVTPKFGPPVLQG